MFNGKTNLQNAHDYLMQFETVQKWLSNINSNETKLHYINYFKIYCDATQKTPDELLQLKVNGLKLTGDIGEFQAEDLLEKFFNNSKMPANAKLSLKNCVFSFYKWNRRSLEKTTASNIKNKIPQAKQRCPNLDDIQTLEDNFFTYRDRAVNRFIASTACRVGEIEKLIWADLKETGNKEVPLMFETESARLKGSGCGKFKGIKHIGFVNKWAYDMLMLYKTEATQKGYNLTDSSPIFIKYNQLKREIKPLSAKGIFDLYLNCSLKAWGNLETKSYSGHDLRSFVNSGLESAKLSENIIAPIMSHKVHGIAQHYSSHETKELMECYISALPFLIPKTASQLEAELTATKETHQKEIDQIKERLNAMDEIQKARFQRLLEKLESNPTPDNELQRTLLKAGINEDKPKQ